MTRCFFLAEASGKQPCLSWSCRSESSRDVCSFVSEVQENKSLVLISRFITEVDASTTGSPPRRGCSLG
jgi:hypothetical protein